jgi:hypothetical protein
VKYAHITPIPLLDSILGPMVGADFHLVVSNEIITTPAYLNFYQRRLRQGDFVILDSPAFETGGIADLEDTLHATMMLRPSEVVLPDDMNSAEKTVAGTKDAMNLLDEVGYSGRYMMVPHGETIEEFIECTYELLSLGAGERTTIGLQEEIPELFRINRAQMIQRLNHQTGAVLTYHLLGIDEGLEDQFTTGARSCDTAKFVVWGLNGKMVTKGLPSHLTPEYPGRKTVGGRTGYFHYTTRDQMAIECARHNVRVWRGR